MRVDFMLIGAQKCGTTSLATQLAAHPEICFCKIKEPGYFHKVEDWRANLNGYHKLFSPASGQKCGEASTMYTFLPEWQDTHVRLFEYNPQLKLIYIMRQPVERVISNYTHDFVRNIVKSPPAIAISNQQAYINRSRYAVQIKPYLELFKRENVLLLIFEDYISDQTKTLQEIAGFLGISANVFKDIGTVTKHKSVGEWYLKHSAMRRFVNSDSFQAVRSYIPTSIRQPVRRRLSRRLQEKPHFPLGLKRTIWRFLEDDVRNIEELLERRLDVWRQGYDGGGY